MKKTKIVCTMGPNTNNEDTMRALVRNGMDIARFNFSHGDHEEQKFRMDIVKKKASRSQFSWIQRDRRSVPVF